MFKITFDIKKFKNSVLYTWLVSYLFVLMVPIVLSIFGYFQTESIVQNQIVESNNIILSSIIKESDALLSDNKKIISSVAFNNAINQAINYQRPLKPSEQYSLYDIVKYLQVFSNSISGLNTIYVYLSNIDAVITPNAVMSSREYYDKVYVSSSVGYDEWVKALTDENIAFLSVSKDRNQNSEDTIILINCMSAGIKTRNLGAVVMEANNVMISKRLNESNMKIKCEYAILDINDNVVLASNELKKIDISSINKPENGFVTLNGNKFIYQSEVSSATGYKYITLISYQNIWGQLTGLRLLNVLVIALGLIIGIFLVFYALRKNYNPLKKLLKNLDGNAGLKNKSPNNEFDIISNAISNISKENQTMNSILKSQNKQLKENFLSRLLTGKALERGTTVQDSLDLFDIKLKSDYYAVMLFYIEDFKELFKDDKDEDVFFQTKTVNYVIGNVIEELIKNQGNIAYVTSEQEMLAAVVSFSPENIEKAKENLYNAASYAHDFLKNNLYIRFTVSISNVHKTIQGISIAYREALDTMEYKLILGDDRVIIYQDENEVSFRYSYTNSKEQLLISYIKTSNYENIEELVYEIFAKAFKDNSTPISLARCLAFDITGTILRLLDEMGDNYDESEIDTAEITKKLLTWETVDELKQAMLQILKNFCEFYLQKNANKIKKIVMDYVQENYMNTGLSVGQIADSLGFHHTYLSATFKEQSGEGLLEYINRYRVEESKKILKSKEPLEDVALQVGYSSLQTYTRVFKKYEGVTPAKYRELNFKQ